MRLARVALVVTFYAGFYGLIFFGGDQAAEITESRWLAALLGLVVSSAYFALFIWAQNLMSSGGAETSADEMPAEDEQHEIEPIGIIVLLSLALILIGSSFGYAGTPIAFCAGFLVGYLFVAVAAPRFEKLSLQS